jgi:hypothetical protein
MFGGGRQSGRLFGATSWGYAIDKLGASISGEGRTPRCATRMRIEN